MNMESKIELYDKILAKIYQNVAVEDQHYNGIYVRGYKNDAASRVYMNMVNSYADVNNKQVTMIMSLLEYIFFILQNWKGRKRYKRYKGKSVKKYATLQGIEECVAQYFVQPATVYEDIYKEYYKKK